MLVVTVNKKLLSRKPLVTILDYSNEKVMNNMDNTLFLGHWSPANDVNEAIGLFLYISLVLEAKESYSTHKKMRHP
jgi:hypothetical protein